MANNTTSLYPSTLDQVSAVEYIALLVTWFLYCCTGDWSRHQPIRILAILQGIASLLVINIWHGTRDLGLSLFATYVLGRYEIDSSRRGCCQGVAVILWMILGTVTAFFPIIRPAKCVYEGLMTLGLLAQLVTMTVVLQERGRRRWLLKLGAIVLWGLGWGLISVLFWLKMIDQILVVAWW